ncbi:DNA recombination/repair protein RecA, partial [Streptomyces sp. NPDC047917]
WYTYEGDQLGQGKENARNFLKDNPDLANEIENKILEKLGIGAHFEEPAAPVRQGTAALPPSTGVAAEQQPYSAAQHAEGLE